MNKKVLVIFSLARVRKSELPEIMNAVLDIVEKYNPVALKIVGMYNLLLELKPQLDILAVKYDGYPNTQEFLRQRMLRDKLLSTILSHLSAIEKAKVSSTTTEAALVAPYLRRYLNGIIIESTTVKSGIVNQLLVNLEGNEQIKTALSNLGFTVYIDELKVCQQDINEGTSQRRETISVRREFNTKNAKASIVGAINNLLNAIELARVEHADIDYMPLINELNVVLSSRKSVIKSRITRKKNSVANNTTTVASSTKTTATAI
jgi:hypothetical protein